jgi:uracil-DNA glycosylase
VQANEYVRCIKFPCTDVRHDCYAVPDVNVSPRDVSLIMISEAAPVNPDDNYYAPGSPLFRQTTLQAFSDAGADFTSMKDMLDAGAYLTTAVKCAKTGYGLKVKTIEECALILEQELALFPGVKVFMLMGDVAIKAFNFIGRRTGEGRVIPAGSTYKIRDHKYFFRGKRVFPSYLQAGPSFFIEKSKRRMIAEDISAALKLV